MGTLSGEAGTSFSFLKMFSLGAALKRKNLLPQEKKYISFKSLASFWKSLSSRELFFFFGQYGRKPYTFRLNESTVKILKFGTPQTIAIIVLKIEKFDVTLH